MDKGGASADQPKIELLLEQVVKRRGSDLHLQVGLPPVIRIDGKLSALPNIAPLTENTLESMVFSLLEEDQKQALLRDKELDFSFAFGDLGRFRVNAFHERGNLAASMRLIPNQILSIEQLNLPPVVAKFADFSHGLILVTGPAGSGKTTTLASLINKINTERSNHIVTIEDPIEYIHDSKKSVVAQREVHYDTYSLSMALRSSLHQDPDVVLIGEMRDLETIAAAVAIAETGHLVFATMHTANAAQSIDRIIDTFPAAQQQQIRVQLSNVLQAISAQRLVSGLAGGRLPATEILFVTPAVRAMIREGKTHQIDSVIQTGLEYGMQSLDATLAEMVHAGLINYDEAAAAAVNVEELNRLMRS